MQCAQIQCAQNATTQAFNNALKVLFKIKILFKLLLFFEKFYKNIWEYFVIFTYISIFYHFYEHKSKHSFILLWAYSVRSLRTRTKMKMLISKLESWSLGKALLSEWPLCRCENTIWVWFWFKTLWAWKQIQFICFHAEQ